MVGIFLRRFRRALVLPLVSGALLLLRPIDLGGGPEFDEISDALGFLIALGGEALRFWAWGANAEVGKHGVRTRGPYALLRHPLYTGNFLIVCGLLIIFNNPLAYPLFMLPFAYLYHTVSELEEERMIHRFGAVYQNYMRNQPSRFLPLLGRFPAARASSHPFGWRYAVGKEYESVLGWVAGVIALRMYEEVLHWGFTQSQRMLFLEGGWLVALGGVALSFYLRKSWKKLYSRL